MEKCLSGLLWRCKARSRHQALSCCQLESKIGRTTQGIVEAEGISLFEEIVDVAPRELLRELESALGPELIAGKGLASCLVSREVAFPRSCWERVPLYATFTIANPRSTASLQLPQVPGIYCHQTVLFGIEQPACANIMSIGLLSMGPATPNT